MIKSESGNQQPEMDDYRKKELKRKYIILAIIIFVFFIVIYKIILNEILSHKYTNVPVAKLPVIPDTNNNLEFFPDDIIINSIGMKMVFIPSGEFFMGTLNLNQNAPSDEVPFHKVTISEDFRMGIYEVTQNQYEEIMGINPGNFKGDELPVENVSWDEAQEFCARLSVKEGQRYRLPSEAEWEYVCRAGTNTLFNFGDDDTLLGDYGWYFFNSNDTTHPGGLKKPNAFGLYDMYGNVAEWCQDWYCHSYYTVTNFVDPVNNDEGDKIFRIIRGGSYDLKSDFLYSAFRRGLKPANKFPFVGFRVVMEID